MAVNGMSVGRDFSYVFIDPNTGGPIDFGDIQGIKITPTKHDIKSSPYNDVPRFGYIPDGYSIAFTMVRTNSNLENWQLLMNNLFNSGGTVRSGFLNETVTDSDGATHRYQYTGVVMFVTDLGDISREKTVTVTVTGMASNKIQLS
jgi:hypothetical protein